MPDLIKTTRRTPKNAWSEKDDTFLAENIDRLTPAQLAKYLNRTVRAVVARMRVKTLVFGDSGRSLKQDGNDFIVVKSTEKSTCHQKKRELPYAESDKRYDPRDKNKILGYAGIGKFIHKIKPKWTKCIIPTKQS